MTIARQKGGPSAMARTSPPPSVSLIGFRAGFVLRICRSVGGSRHPLVAAAGIEPARAKPEAF